MVKLITTTSHIITLVSIALFVKWPIVSMTGLLMSIIVQELKSDILYKKYCKYKNVTQMYRKLVTRRVTAK